MAGEFEILEKAYHSLFTDTFNLGDIIEKAKSNFEDPKVKAALKRMEKGSLLTVKKAVIKHNLKFGAVATSTAVITISGKEVIPLVLKQTKRYPQYADLLWTYDGHVNSTKDMLQAHKLPINDSEIKQAASKVGNNVKPKQLQIQRQEFDKTRLELKRSKKIIASNEKAIKVVGKKYDISTSSQKQIIKEKLEPIRQKLKIQNDKLKSIYGSIEKNTTSLKKNRITNTLNKHLLKNANDSFMKAGGKLFVRAAVVGALAYMSLPIVVFAISIAFDIGLDLIAKNGGLLKTAEKISDSISKLAKFTIAKLPDLNISISGTLLSKVQDDHAYTSRKLNKNAPPKYSYKYA